MNSPALVSRRQVLAALAVSPFSAVLTKATAPALSKSATFVLVHGAWHGDWCWKRLTPLLRAAGHEVFVPTLTGLGERSHLLSPDVDLNTHIKDITAVLEYEDLQEVVLVGHSYGGMVIAGVAEKAGTRLAQLVYLDAFLPENGKALKDYTPANLDEAARTKGEGWRLPPQGSPRDFGVTNERDIAWMQSRLGDQPYKTFTQSIQLSTDKSKSLAQTFIQCSKAPFFAEAADRARRQGFRYRELFSAGHDAMITQPKELAKLLRSLV